MKQLRKDGARRRRFLKKLSGRHVWRCRRWRTACPGTANQQRHPPVRRELFGVDFTDAEEEQALAGVTQPQRVRACLRAFDVPLDTEPAIRRSARTFRARHQSPGRRPARNILK